jgi:hypothetical protein
MNARLVRNCGLVLIGVFLVTIVAILLPLDLSSATWGIQLSTMVVDAASLPLVGLLLLRYSAHLDAESAKALALQQAAPASVGSAREGESDPIAVDPEFLRMITPDPIQGLRNFAFAGFVSLLLLGVWQFALLFSSVDLLDKQNLAISTQIDERFVALERQINTAPAEEISKSWSQFQKGQDVATSMSKGDPAAQRSEMLNKVKQQKLDAFNEISDKKGKQLSNLVRSILRVALISIIYAWGFYGIAKL